MYSTCARPRSGLGLNELLGLSDGQMPVIALPALIWVQLFPVSVEQSAGFAFGLAKVAVTNEIFTAALAFAWLVGWCHENLAET